MVLDGHAATKGSGLASQPQEGGAVSAEERERVLYDLARHVLDAMPIPDVAREISDAVARVLGADFACVMRLQEAGGKLVLQSAVGFEQGLVGNFTVAVGKAARLGYVSQAGYTMISDLPVVVEDLSEERHFEGCELLKRHSVGSGITVRVDTDTPDEPYGLVGAHWRGPRRMIGWEADWLAEAAHILGSAAGLRSATRSSCSAELEAENARRECLMARRRHENLRDAMAYVASSRDPLAALDAAASLAVHHGADWCFVDLKEDDGKPGYAVGDTIRRVVIRHAGRDPRTLQLAEALASHYPENPMAPHGTPRVLRRQGSHRVERLTREDIERSANGPEHLRHLQRMEPTSVAAALLLAGGRPAGAMVAITTGGKRLSADDLEVLEELAWCASLALSSDVAGLSADREAERITDLARSDPSVGQAGQPEEAFVSSDASVPAPGGGEAPALGVPRLTSRLREVLALRARGLSRREIGTELCISEATVKSHMAKICTALSVKGSRQAVAKARELGEIPPV